MTVESSTDASPVSPPLAWKTIDWPRVWQEVRRLQMRIAKATQAGRYRKVQALQWVLTHSHAAKLLAVHKVTTNRGAISPLLSNLALDGMEQALKAVTRRGDKVNFVRCAERRAHRSAVRRVRSCPAR